MGLVAAETNGRLHDTEALYREHGAAVGALCRSLLRDRADAEDATQQVFLSAHRALLKGAVPREPAAWLLAVARNECYARFRQRAAAPVPSDETPDVATADASVHVLRAGELDTVWDEIGQMPPLQREAFLLREIRGLSYGQLAEELALSAPSVRSLLLRARSRLRQRLGGMTAGLGGAQWVQALVRLVGGGDGASPLPAATRAAAVGVSALALVGGGAPLAHHATKVPAHASRRHPAQARARRVVASAAVAVAPHRSRAMLGDHRSPLGRSERRADGSQESDGGHEGPGSGDTAAAPQRTGDGSDGGSGSSTGSGSDGGGNSSSSGSDGDTRSNPTVTTSSSTSSNSGSSKSGSSDSGSSDGSSGSHGSDGGSSDGHGG